MSETHRASPSSTSGSSVTDGNASSGVGQEATGEDGEEQEESSSSNENVEELLVSFREQWQREIERSPQKGASMSTRVLRQEQQQKKHQQEDVHNQQQQNQQEQQQLDYNDVTTVESEAKTFFLKGVQYEKDGKLYDAIRFYRKAVQLVPDIEFRLYNYSKGKPQDQIEEEIVDENVADSDEKTDSDSQDDEDILSRIQRIFNKTNCICVPQHLQKATHISSLPLEIMLYIMRWVVSSELDVRSLELCSRVCRGFYLCSRDPKVWRLACIRVWGVNCGDFSPYQSWRDMYIRRPRLNFNGCYISKTSYIRFGENSFQDQFYRPVHLVDYFRYLRFFPGGAVLMLTTADEPAGIVAHLSQRNARHPQVLSGYYRLSGSRVTVVLKRQRPVRSKGRRGEAAYDPGEQTFHLELQILNYRKRVHVQLVWECYTIFTRFRNGDETSTSFSVQGNLYPPFWFSRVKSYTAISESPLQ